MAISRVVEDNEGGRRNGRSKPSGWLTGYFDLLNTNMQTELVQLLQGKIDLSMQSNPTVCLGGLAEPPAAGGLRWPSESRALLAFIARATCCRCVGPEMRPLAFDRDYASKQRRTEDPKGMYTYTGTQGICTSASNWRRRTYSFDIVLRSEALLSTIR